MEPDQNVNLRKNNASMFCSGCVSSSTGQVWLGGPWYEMEVPALCQAQTHTWISASPELGEEYFVGQAYQQREQKPKVCDHWNLVSAGNLFPGKSTGKNLVGLAAWSKGSRAARGTEWGKCKVFLHFINCESPKGFSMWFPAMQGDKMCPFRWMVGVPALLFQDLNAVLHTEPHRLLQE